MRIISTGTLKSFWEKPGRRDVEQPLRTWIRVVMAADWANPADVRRTFNSADHLGDGRMIFDIGGNKYRLIVWINYHYGVIYVRFIGTHAEYDQIDPRTV